MELYNSAAIPDALKDCGAVILADQTILSQTECDALRSFVRAGGALLVTGATGTRDERNAPLADFALSDLVGVSHRGAGETGTCYLRTTGRPRYPGSWHGCHVPARYAK